LSRMGKCIPWFSFWMGQREKKGANRPWNIQNWMNLPKHGRRGKSKGGLNVQGVFILFGCLLIIRGAARGNHEMTKLMGWIVKRLGAIDGVPNGGSTRVTIKVRSSNSFTRKETKTKKPWLHQVEAYMET
jgi:hypothetical protein